MPPSPRVSLLVLSLATVACTSSYEGRKLGPDGQADSITGIPYTLSRPEFQLERTDAGPPPRYRLTVAYVPDPEQRYTLRLSPALLANTTFGLELGEGGQISSVTTKVTEQVTPTVKSLFAFAGQAVSFAVTAGATGRMKITANLHPYAECLTRVGKEDQAECAFAKLEADASQEPIKGDDGLCTHADAKTIHDRVRIFAPVSPGALPRPGLLAQLHYLDQGEKICIGIAASQIREAREKLLQFQNAALDSALTAPIDAVFGDHMKRILKDADLAGGQRIARAIIRAKQGDEDMLRRELKLGKEEINSARWADALTAIGFTLEFTPTEKSPLPPPPAESVLRHREIMDLVSGLGAIVALDPTHWRARHIGYLSSLIDARLLELLTASPPADPTLDPRLRDLRRQLAATAGESGAFARLVKLEQKLDNVPAQLRRFRNYAVLREEADKLKARIIQATEAIVAAAKQPAKPDSLPATIVRIAEHCIEQSQAPGWILGEGAAAPDFALVIRSAASQDVTVKAGAEACP